MAVIEQIAYCYSIRKPSLLKKYHGITIVKSTMVFWGSKFYHVTNISLLCADVPLRVLTAMLCVGICFAFMQQS